ncbi:MAG TPA: endo-1,4-beta-xylanase [Tepidisphaeraceae bacterium]|nr:endo-1,4-beta-xylanase [Tepidisphaeraceae bacterium]
MVISVLLVPVTEARDATLRNSAGAQLLIGTAVSASDLDNPKLAALIADQFNCVTAENEFKPDSLQSERGKFTFGQADKIADFAYAHDMQMIGHTLLWHHQSPAWLFEDEQKQPLPREQALANLKTHIETVAKHFQGRVAGWDVVNEAISDNDGEYLRDTPARRAIGDDYLVKAFQFAHEADPNAQLYYNDYNIETPGKREKAIRLIKELKAAGVRIDGVGIQGHWLLEFPKSNVVDDAIDAFGALGVKVMITELDVDVLPRRGAGADLGATEKQGVDPYRDGLPDDIQEKLARRYEELFKIFVKHRGTLTRVTLWGADDGNSWLNNWPVKGRVNHPLLFDRNFQPKPAFSAVIKALGS